MFDGEVKGYSRRVIDSQDTETMRRDERCRDLIRHGEMYWKLLKKQCRYYKGKTREFPYIVVGTEALSISKVYADVLPG